MQRDEERDDRAPAAGPSGVHSARSVSSEGGAVRRGALDAARSAAAEADRRVAPPRRVIVEDGAHSGSVNAGDYSTVLVSGVDSRKGVEAEGGGEGRARGQHTYSNSYFVVQEFNCHPASRSIHQSCVMLMRPPAVVHLYLILCVSQLFSPPRSALSIGPIPLPTHSVHELRAGSTRIEKQQEGTAHGERGAAVSTHFVLLISLASDSTVLYSLLSFNCSARIFSASIAPRVYY